MGFLMNVFKVGLVILTLIACSHGPTPTPLSEWLGETGDNLPEIEKARDHFEHDSDPQKLIALKYLLANMAGHSYVAVELFDSLDHIIPFCVTDFSDYNSMVTGMDSLELQTGELHYEKSLVQMDLETISAEFIIENIEWAFKAWQELAWAQSLDYKEFQSYILPYRGSNEPIESFRPLFWHRYHDMLIDSDIGNDPVQAAALINQDLTSWFKFDERYYQHPTDQGVAEMMDMKLGRCEDMTNLAIAAMRANGIAVTSDYTPYWANSGNNHAWNAVLSLDKKIIPFMGCESDPGDYTLRNKLAKVYRKMYGEQSENLAFIKEEWEKVPRWLSGKNYLDVTSDYVDVSDVTLNLDSIPDSTNFAYLCVFNSGEWGAIHWGRTIENQVRFTDMGRDIVYLPAFYIDEELIPASSPFILDVDGKIIPLDSDATSDDQELDLISTTKRKLAVATDGIVETFFTEGSEYEIFFWQNDWVSRGKISAQGQPLKFTVPEDGLYWLVDVNGRRQERIFTWENGQQIWW